MHNLSLQLLYIFFLNGSDFSIYKILNLLRMRITHAPCFLYIVYILFSLASFTQHSADVLFCHFHFILFLVLESKMHFTFQFRFKFWFICCIRDRREIHQGNEEWRKVNDRGLKKTYKKRINKNSKSKNYFKLLHF